MMKENLKIWKETISLISWHSHFVLFFQPSGRSFALKSCPRGRDFDEKHYWPGGQPGGTVTGQIDTCNSSTLEVPLR